MTGASSGIGEALARALAVRGHDLVLVGRRRTRLERLARELSLSGVAAQALVCDLTDREDRAQLAATVAGQGLAVSVLVNCAGSGIPGRVAEVPVDDQVHLVRLDLEAVVDLCGRFVPAMVRSGRGAVLNVCSISGFAPLPAMATYAAAKAAALSFSQALHAELRPHRIAVTGLCPGFVRTEFTEIPGLREAAAAAPHWLFTDPRGVAEHGLRALDGNRRVTVPSLLYRSAATVLRLVPNAVLLEALDRWSPFRRDGVIAGAARGAPTR